MALIFAGNPADVSMESSEPSETDLLNVMKLFPCIYDPSHPEYSNIQHNRIAWYKLSNSLQIPVIECINKWYALLQIFLCLNKQVKDDHNHCSVKWYHYNAMLKLRPQVPQTYAQLLQERPPFLYGKPLVRQRELLIKQMEMNRKSLLNVLVSLETKQKIWYQITQKLNYCSGVIMPVIKWQKYWCELKQSVIEVKRRNLMKSSTDSGKSMGTENFSDNDIQILNIFGVKPMDTLEEISSALSGYLEIDCDMENSVSLCNRCNKVIDSPVNKQRCEACSKIPSTFCDLCMRIYPTDLTVYKVQNWTSAAKLILPPKVISFASISTCASCTDGLKRQAGLKWIACRVCESYNHPLDNLFSNENEVLRKAFTDATGVVFKNTDGLPSYICKVCKVQMQQFNNFYLKFDRVQARLREIQNEYFIGKQGRHNSNSPAHRLSIPKSTVNVAPEANRIDPINGQNSPTTSVGVHRLTISSITTSCPPKQRVTNIHPIVMPTIGSTIVSQIPNQMYGQQNKKAVPQCLPTCSNVPASEKPLMAQIPSNLKIVKGLPLGGNVQTIPPTSHQIVPAGKIVPILPKQSCRLPSSNQPRINKIIPQNSVAVRPILPLPASTTITLREKPNIGTISPLSISPTVSLIKGQQASVSNVRTHITIRTNPGTNNVSPSASTLKPTENSTKICMVPGRKPQTAEPPVVSLPNVFKIPRDTFDPNSPPAFCIPKSTMQCATISGTEGESKNKEVPKSIQIAETSNIPLTINNPVEIKKEIIDVDDAQNSCKVGLLNPNENENRIPLIPSQPSTSGDKVPKNPANTNLNLVQTEAHNFEKTSLGVRKSQQNSAQQPLPSQSQHSTIGNKRPRKYWGAVDEFHIPSKLPNQTPLANAACPQITIKEEAIDVEVVNDDAPTDASNNDSFTNMFYPDAFELCSVSLDADVTKVLQHMIEHQSTANAEASQLTNTSMTTNAEIPNPSTNDGNVAADQQVGNLSNSAPQPKLPCQTNDALQVRTDLTAEPKVKIDSKEELDCEPSKEMRTSYKTKFNSDCKSLTLRILRAKFDDKTKDIPKENEFTSKSKKFHLKKLRVKLRKSKNLQSLILDTIRSKTIIRRKSTRLVKNVI